jgi:hypothetical protein
MTPEEIEALLFEVDATRIGADSARRVAALIAEEREACAQLALDVSVDWNNVEAHPDPDPVYPGEHLPHDDGTCRLCIAAAIRART